jgi:hypothetical protein
MNQRDDHVTAGLALLITQYKDKPNLAAVISSYLTQAQEIEDMLFDILAIIESPWTQVGEQLDLIGRVVGQAREGRSDADYVPWLQARLLVNRSSGVSSDFFSVAALVAPAATRAYSEWFPAAFLFELHPLTDAALIAQILGEMRPAGVNGQLLYYADAAETFTFADADTVNLLTADCRDAENAPTGYTPMFFASLSAGTTVIWQGSRSLKVNTLMPGDGVYATPISGVSGKTYTGSVYVAGPVGKTVLVSMIDVTHGTASSVGVTFAATDVFERAEVSLTLVADTVNMRLEIAVPGAGLTLYCDGFQVEIAAAATAWTDCGTDEDQQGWADDAQTTGGKMADVEVM